MNAANALDNTEAPPLEVLVARATGAEQGRDLEAALAGWNQVLSHYSSRPIGYAAAASVLRQLNRVEEANALLLEGLEKFPSDQSIAAQHAWLAHHLRDWPEVHARWEAFRRKFPDVILSYTADATVLRYMGCFDDSEKTYLEIFSRWPAASDFDLLADYAELAQARGKVIEASARWREVRKRFPDRPNGYVRDAANLIAAGRYRDAEALLRDAVRLCPDEPTVSIEYARSADSTGDVHEALKRWEAMLKAFPGVIDGYLGATSLLIAASRYEDAENVFHPALQLFPNSMDLAEMHARLAFAKYDFPEATKRWAAFRDRYPAIPAGYSGGVDALLALSQHSEARSLSERARALFPADDHIAANWCWVEECARNWDEAERRWSLTSRQFPGALHVTSGYARTLAQIKKWTEAEALLSAALVQHPADDGLLRSYAECATEQGDWSAAESRWRKVLEFAPRSSFGWRGLGNALCRAGRLDDAATVFTEGLVKFPGDPDLEEGLAMTLTYRRDWPSALSLWNDLKRRFPHKPSVISGSTDALWRAKQELEIASMDGLPRPFEIPGGLLQSEETAVDQRSALKALLMKFESLGDSCEFGMVQRRFGAEPIGLLRWATTAPDELIAVLNARFAGVGDDEHTVVEALRGEYISWDRRYSMYSHTFTPATAEPLEGFRKRHLRSMKFMKRKLIEDLEGGNKIFVYIYDEGLSREQAADIHRAIRTYNKRSAMVYVNVSADPNLTGTVTPIDDGLFMGIVDRYSTVDINYDAWLTVCRRVREMIAANAAAPTASQVPERV
jgi:tetratricopeptide (TPR) repeat protein